MCTSLIIGCGLVVATPSWVGLIGFCAQKVYVVGNHFTVVAGNIAECRDMLLGVCSYHGVEVILQGMEDGDEEVDVVNTNTHLEGDEGGGEGRERGGEWRGGEGREGDGVL